MHSKKYLAVFLVICMMSSDFMIPVVLAGHHHGQNNHGLELLLAAGILAKLLRKKGHHHHGHHHHHHKGRHAEGGIHLPHEHGAQTVEVVHVAPPLGGYSSHYPTSAQSSYGGAQAATTSFSASIEYPFSPSASQAMPIHHLPYGGPASAASYLGYEPQPVQVYPPLPLSITESGPPVHA